jgi:hypothetical protein
MTLGPTVKDSHQPSLSLRTPSTSTKIILNDARLRQLKMSESTVVTFAKTIAGANNQPIQTERGFYPLELQLRFREIQAEISALFGLTVPPHR